LLADCKIGRSSSYQNVSPLKHSESSKTLIEGLIQSVIHTLKRIGPSLMILKSGSRSFKGYT